MSVEADLSRAATEDEKKLLRNATLVREASEEEVQQWLQVSNTHMNEKSRTAFAGMSKQNQFRVISEGPMKECQDSVEILYARVNRFMAMEAELKKLANSDGRATGSRKKEVKISDLAKAIGKAIVNEAQVLDEVPLEERRTGGYAQAIEEPKEKPILVGNVKGIGGVIEAIQKKYSMQKGERAKVTNETKELWKFADERTVPKVHCNTGWKWVLAGAKEEEAKKAKKPEAKAAPNAAPKAAPAAPAAPQAKAQEAEPRGLSREKASKSGRSGEKGKKERSRSGEKGRKERSRSGDRGKKKGKRRRSSSSSGGSRKGSPSSSASRSRGRQKSKEAEKKRKKGKSSGKDAKKSRKRRGSSSSSQS